MFSLGVNVTSYPVFTTVGTILVSVHANVPYSVLPPFNVTSANVVSGLYVIAFAVGNVIVGAAALFIFNVAFNVLLLSALPTTTISS